nr:T9SS type A sorting domain-containing protein [Polaribacter porphyrae]
MVIPIGIKSEINKEFIISASGLNLPNSVNIYLEDKKKNAFINLSQDNYKTTLDASSDELGRFFIHASSSALSANNSTLVDVNVYRKNNNILRISGLDNSNATVSLYNLLGKKVMFSKFSSPQSNIELKLPKLATGVYIFKLETAKGSLNKKIILE